jgi:unsaturated chondroitin disaccharide hydrolase
LRKLFLAILCSAINDVILWVERMKTDRVISPADLLRPLDRLFESAIGKVTAIEKSWDPSKGAPVFTVEGKYTTRGWTEWTQGFQYGCGILAFDATDDRSLLDTARSHVVQRMATHVTHFGVHDHGFNNISTYGNLRRLMLEERIAHNEWELAFYEMAIKASGAVQANRWAIVGGGGGGYIYSFNGEHSLFIDTMRTLRVLGLAHQLGHALMGEGDRSISLLGRLIYHALVSAEYNIYYGESRDTYDMPGRTAHESIFNRQSRQYRCASSQQGYSPWSTWTRGLAWAVLGFSEELEFFRALKSDDFQHVPMVNPRMFKLARDYPSVASLSPKFRDFCLNVMERAARVTADFYIDQATTSDGVPYWDTGAPGLHKLGDWKNAPADPFNDHEPVDSSAAAIAAQGLIRLGRYLKEEKYTQAGLAVAATLLDEPYLSTDPNHQGLLLHSVYHRPNGWDYIPPGRKVPCGESSMWGDYHLLELGLLIRRMAQGKYLTFFDGA